MPFNKPKLTFTCKRPVSGGVLSRDSVHCSYKHCVVFLICLICTWNLQIIKTHFTIATQGGKEITFEFSITPSIQSKYERSLTGSLGLSSIPLTVWNNERNSDYWQSLKTRQWIGEIKGKSKNLITVKRNWKQYSFPQSLVGSSGHFDVSLHSGFRTMWLCLSFPLKFI